MQKEGLGIVGSLKKAFYAVAVECTVKYSEEEGDNKFCVATESLWKGKLVILLEQGRFNWQQRRLRSGPRISNQPCVMLI